MDEWVKLRKDLVVTEKYENGNKTYFVSDPLNDESYEFGEQEWFLLQCLDGASNPDEIIEKLSARYKIILSQEQFDDFISMVKKWGIVVGKNGNIQIDKTNTLANESNSSTGNEDIIDTSYEDITGIINADKPFRYKRPGHIKSEQSVKTEVNWVLFNPNRLLSGLSWLLLPSRWVRYLIPVLLIIACAIIFNNLQIFVYDFLRFRTPLSIIQILVFSMFTANIISQLGRGVVARGLDVNVDKFGIKLVLGVLPRFAVDTSSLEHLPRGQKLEYYSSPLLIRLALFSLSTLLWFMSRSTGTLLPTISLMLLVVAIVSFFLSANPLYNSDGYKVLTTLLEMPNLRRKANLALFGSKNSPLADRFIHEDNVFALRSYALSSIIFLVILLGAILVLAARWFEINYQGTGVVIYLSLTIYLLLRLYRQFIAKRTEMKEKRSRFEARMPARSDSEMSADNVQRTGRSSRVSDKSGRRARSGEKTGWWRRQWREHKLRAVFLLLFSIVIFLPYPYEAGGVLVVLPNKQHEIYAETPGVIKDVMHKDGEFLKAGIIVATLSSYEQEKNLLTTQASILEQEARLEQLRNTPTKEDINLAKSRLETARTQYKYTSESAKRLEALYKDGNVSLDDYQDEQKQMMVDRAQVSEAQANLDKVIAGPHPKEIEAAEFELRRLKEKLKYDQEEINRTNLTMPMGGRIVTENLDHLVGQFLDEGDYFATVENDEYVRIQIKVPESDISDVKLESDARFKVWAHGDRLFYGQVTEIAPTALEEKYGKVIVVTVVVPNEDDLLKSGMTGFGKVDGGSKLVIVAFTRMLVRFFTIEMWSWIP